MLNYYFDNYNSQLFLYVNGETETSKFKVIDIISRYLFFHSAQREIFFNSILKAILINVTAYNILKNTFYRLFFLLVKNEF